MSSDNNNKITRNTFLNTRCIIDTASANKKKHATNNPAKEGGGRARWF